MDKTSSLGDGAAGRRFQGLQHEKLQRRSCSSKSRPSPPPRGRRPGREDTRAIIKAAALTLFSEQGYDKVSLRAIARAADVDPALIHHYFESKAELFARTVLDLPVDAEAIPVHEAWAIASVREFLQVWEGPDGGRERLTAALRSAVSDETGRRPMSEFMIREVFTPIADALGHPNAKLRGQLAVSLLLGLALARYVVKFPALAHSKESLLAEQVGGAGHDVGRQGRPAGDRRAAAGHRGGGERRDVPQHRQRIHPSGMAA